MPPCVSMIQEHQRAVINWCSTVPKRTPTDAASGRGDFIPI
jgi:hypothetical protein